MQYRPGLARRVRPRQLSRSPHGTAGLFRVVMFVIVKISVSSRADGKLITAASGLGELRNVVEAAGLPRLEEGDRGAGRTMACPG